ncbi:MAG: type II toxin-antitoxin system VapC family toxin [Chloroflexota bacterium]|nr:type II toxin-antitoxin system VapC family toxin [Chloroflexota bacterium]
MISVVSDANVAFKWFHADGEPEVEASRALVHLFGERLISLSVLDLTKYEVGSALLRGRAAVSAHQASTVLNALAEICPQLKPSVVEMRDAAGLAEQHGLTLYDAAYAAVARSRGAELATMDKALLKAGLGHRPSEIVARVGE